MVTQKKTSENKSRMFVFNPSLQRTESMFIFEKEQDKFSKM